MNPVFEVILEAFKKANKQVRAKMAEKYGFSSADQLEKYLTDPASNPNPPMPSPSTRVTKKKTKVNIKVEEVEVPTDMVIAFDTTGSMRVYIAEVRKHVQKTINELFETVPNLRLKIVAFGDYCDMVSSSEFGKAYQQIELTNNKAALIQFVQDAKDTGGGDQEEFYELVLHRIINETSWRKEANKAILLIADHDPHEEGYSLSPFVKNAQYDWRKEAASAASKGIKVDTLRIIPGTSWYAELSKITNGSCMDFRSSGKTSELVMGATYLSSRSKEGILKAKAMYKSAITDGDNELVGVYKGMAASRGISLDD